MARDIKRVVLAYSGGLDTSVILKWIKEEYGAEVVEADGGKEAIRQYLRNRPDAVTLDMLMPDMEGPEVLDKLMALDPGARVIVCSSNIQAFAKAGMKAKGAREYLNKPIKGPELIAVMEQVMEDKEDATVSE